ncbi:stage V sporulation protein D [Clostridium sp. 19966]|uniref:stage V sporulation protein D n=1 Tax=Clostridium sp. 19966 TaxID=2768166 RepID=UPI0028EAD0EF|nr:stage V sporulation protein D [Clostridium sp. 19966]
MRINNYRDKVIVKRRILISVGVIAVLFFSLILRLFYLMVLQQNKLKGLATEQWTNEVKIDAKRGKILDRYGNELAVSANVYRVDLDMNTIRNYMKRNNQSFEAIAAKLSKALDMDNAKVLKELTTTLKSGKDRGSAILARRIEKDKADKVNDLKISGVLVSPDTKRYYPENNFLSQVIGTTNSDGDGLAGVELEYNKLLKGTPGFRISEIDRNNDELPYIISDFTKPVQGKDIVLTIDEKMQYFAEKAAQQAMNDNKAKAVTIMIMNPKNGEILALANTPGFDPNNPREGANSPDEMAQKWRNRAVSDTYEPGSIFKVITAIAAMEKGVVSDSDTFVCNGSLNVAGANIHCWKTSGHGTESFVDILKNSCNVGFMVLGSRLGAANLNEYINKFGFGSKTNIDLPGEAKGIIRKTSSIGPVDLATISFGQSNTVTPVQYMTAFNAIVNGGYLITPHVMKDIQQEDANGNEVIDSTFEQYDKNYQKKQIIDKTQADKLRSYLEKVVSEGGGKKAFIDGYHIAGKTGTAQKVNPQTGAYEAGKYVASFAGTAPANDPKVSVFISIDEPDPSNYYAGQIAAPVAKQVFYDIFNYISLKGDVNVEDTARSMLNDVIVPNVIGNKKSDAVSTLTKSNLKCDVKVQGDGDTIIDMNPKPGYTTKEGTTVVLYMGNAASASEDIVVPDLSGYSKEKAQEVLASLGIKASFIGTGIITDQSVDPGQIIKKDDTLNIEMEDTPGD